MRGIRPRRAMGGPIPPPSRERSPGRIPTHLRGLDARRPPRAPQGRPPPAPVPREVPLSHTEAPQGTRRDFIYYATAGAGAVVTGAAVWPLVNTMNPSADVTALASIRVDVAGVTPGTQLTVLWQGKPVFIRARTEEEIASARETP